jgi:hypothetical protein
LTAISFDLFLALDCRRVDFRGKESEKSLYLVQSLAEGFPQLLHLALVLLTANNLDDIFSAIFLVFEFKPEIRSVILIFKFLPELKDKVLEVIELDLGGLENDRDCEGHRLVDKLLDLIEIVGHVVCDLHFITSTGEVLDNFRVLFLELI